MNIKQCVNDLIKILHNKRHKSEDDPLLSQRANTVREFYKGYPYIIKWDYGNPWRFEHIGKAEDWCVENCTGKFTNHIHRVISGPEYINVPKDDWEFNELGGDDYLFWAFTDEKDAIMFRLKW